MHKAGKGEKRKFELNFYGGRTIPLTANWEEGFIAALAQLLLQKGEKECELFLRKDRMEEVSS